MSLIPINNIITDIENADVVKMDRWTLKVTPISDLVEEDMENCSSHMTTTDNAEKNLVIHNSVFTLIYYYIILYYYCYIYFPLSL